MITKLHTKGKQWQRIVLCYLQLAFSHPFCFAGSLKIIAAQRCTSTLLREKQTPRFPPDAKLATTTSSGGLLSALQRAMLLLAPKGGIASNFTGPL